MCKTCFHFLDPIYQEYELKHGNIQANSKLHLSYSALTQRLKDTRLKTKDAKNPLNPENQEEEIEPESQDLVEPNDETAVVVTRRIKSEKSHNSSSASSLTEEQMEVISTLNLDYANKNLPFDDEEEEEEDHSNMYEDLNEMTSQDTNKNLKITIEDSSESIDKIRPPISPKPTPEAIMRRSKQSLSSDSSEPGCQLTSPRVLNKLSLINKLAREVVEAEYGFLCKVPIAKNEFNMDSDEEELQKDSKSIKKKWDRYYMVFYSDRTIGICTNQNVIKLNKVPIVP